MKKKTSAYIEWTDDPDAIEGALNDVVEILGGEDDRDARRLLSSRPILVKELFVPKKERGMGKGTELLTSFLEMADRGKRVVIGEAMPFEHKYADDLDERQARLKSWYEKFGFEDLAPFDWIIRFPKKARS